ncbi:MAG: hypothetical protein ACLQJR_11730 [Stellaceae bacterium]
MIRVPVKDGAWSKHKEPAPRDLPAAQAWVEMITRRRDARDLAAGVGVPLRSISSLGTRYRVSFGRKYMWLFPYAAGGPVWTDSEFWKIEPPTGVRSRAMASPQIDPFS